MAKSYNVSFNILGNLDPSLLSALQGAARAMKNLDAVSRAMQSRLNQYARTNAAAQGVLKNIEAYKNLTAAYRDNVQQQARLQLRNTQLNAQRQQEEQKLADMRTGYDALKNARTRLNRELRQATRSGAVAEQQRLKAAVDSVNAALKQGRAEIKGQQQAIKNIGKEYDLNSRNAQRLRDTLAQQQTQLSQLRTRIPTSNLAAAEAALRSQIDQTTAALNREIAALQHRNQLHANFHQASQNLSNAYNNFQNSVQTAETVMSPFKAAAENAITFEHAMSRVKSLTQSQNIREGRTDIVEREMRELTEQARYLGATTMFTATQAADAMGYLGMAGWKQPQIIGTMPGMLNLAAAAGADLAQTADIVSDNMTAMGVPVAQASHFMDVYAYALTNSNARLTDFGETMKYAAPVFKAYGASLEEGAAMAMMMANAGIKGSMAGTSLRMGLLRLAGPPKTATKEMQKLGLSLSDAQAGAEEAAAVIKGLGIDIDGAANPGEKMTRVLMQLHEKTKDLSQDEKLAVFKGIFGVNAETGWLALFDQGPEQFLKYVEGLRDADGYSAQVAFTMNDDTRGALIVLESAIDALTERIGEALAPAIKAAAEALAPMITNLALWIEKNQAAVQWAAILAAAISAAMVAFTGLAVVGAVFPYIVSGIQLVVNTVRFLATAFRVAAMASAAWGAVTAAAGVIATAPVWAIVAAIVAVIAVIGYATGAFDGLGAAISAAWNDPRGAVTGFAELVKSSVDSAVQYVIDRWNTLKSALANPLEATINFFDHGSVVGGNVKSGEELRSGSPQVDTAAVKNAAAHQVAQPQLTLPTYLQQAQPQVNVEVKPEIKIDASQIQQPQVQGVQELAISTPIASAAMQMLAPATQMAGAGMTQLSMSTPMVGAGMTGLAMSTPMTNAAMLQLAPSTTNATTGINTFSAALPLPIGGLNTLGTSSSSAAGQVGSMGAAAGAVSGALAAKAAEISSIHISVPTVSVAGAAPAANYMGGIYRKGAFVTTFAERSAEAAIPLDNSQRAQDLWTQAGQILGLLPVTQAVTYDMPTNRPTRTQPFNMPKVFTQTQPTFYPVFGDTNPIISAQDTAGIGNRSFSTSSTLNVTINVNISGNADEATVRRGVESALPQLDDWFSRYTEHMREERRRSYA